MILPSILSTSHLHLYEKLEALRDLAKIIHVDIEDGVFVSNLSFGPKIIKEIYTEFDFELDIHYMVKDPQNFIDLFNDIPQAWVSYHAETGISPNEIKVPSGTKLGIAINPDTTQLPHDTLSAIDFLVIMGVFPGFGGAKFEESTYDLVKNFNSLRMENNYKYDILVDGGVTKENIIKLKECGGDHFVVGSGIFKNDPRNSFIELNKMCDKYDGH